MKNDDSLTNIDKYTQDNKVPNHRFNVTQTTISFKTQHMQIFTEMIFTGTPIVKIAN